MQHKVQYELTSPAKNYFFCMIWIAFLFFAGVVCPPALALAFVRWWRSRAFWLVWAGYLAFVAESALLATLLVFLLSPLNNLLGGARL
jgi:hypothetical protein